MMKAGSAATGLVEHEGARRRLSANHLHAGDVHAARLQCRQVRASIRIVAEPADEGHAMTELGKGQGYAGRASAEASFRLDPTKELRGSPWCGWCAHLPGEGDGGVAR